MPSPHDYQLRMVDHIVANPATALFAEVGLGKTAAALLAIQKLHRQCDVFSVLVVAPKRVAEHVWMQERDIWTPDLSMTIITGSRQERLRAARRPSVVHVIGRDNLAALIEDLGPSWPYHCLLMDESQGFKDSGTRRFRALKKVTRHHDRVVLMSATPASESLLGLWAQIYLADAGERLGKNFTKYKETYFEGDYMGWRWMPKPRAEGVIHSKIADMAVSLTAADHLKLPPRIDNKVDVVLDDIEMRHYRELERHYLLPLKDGDVSAANAAVLGNKLLQLTSGAVYDDERQVMVIHDKKIEALKELVESANGSPVLVFYQYLHEVERIKAAIKGAEELDVPKWNLGKQRVALAHPRSAGAGLNLQFGGSLIAWFSLPWSLDQYIQACGRLYRQGQKNTVVIHHLIAGGTIDEDVMAVLADKTAVQERLIEALKRRFNQGEST